jgi:hypothetical protein
MSEKIDRIIILVAVTICVYAFCTHSYDVHNSLESMGKVIDAQSRYMEDIRVEVDKLKNTKPKTLKVFTDDELEKMAAHEERAGMGMSFYYDELRKRNDAKWAKEELERRRLENEKAMKSEELPFKRNKI